jgi:GMP reductase
MGDLSLFTRKEMKFDFDDILIEFEDTSDIYSRKGIRIYDENGKLPIITAPMDTVINSQNEKYFVNNRMVICQPRGQKAGVSKAFESYSLADFEKKFIDERIESDRTMYVLIDMANGHMKRLATSIQKAKSIYGEALFIMAGNVGTPGAYSVLAKAGADAVRVGVGNGNGCLTTKQTGGGYPMASLIYECYLYSLGMDYKALIIADGGMKDYEDVIKAIALGADYVMLGSILNKALESCGPTTLYGFSINPIGKLAKWAFRKNLPLKKKFRGMSTKEVQKSWGNSQIKTSEGVVRYRPVEYTLEQWSDNFEHYLKSIMSYTNSINLEEFRGNVKFNIISENARKRFNK